MKVKICGITNIEDASVAIDYGADALGFVFYNQSKRFIELEKAKNIIDKLNPFVRKVGVFVNETVTKINTLAKEAGLNLVQLHSDESPRFISEIDLPVIKAFRVKDDFDYNFLDEYTGSSILLDAYEMNNYGGTGNRFDWKLIPPSARSRIILAGGISIDDLELIFADIRPQIIDVSSSVEEYPGKKDHKKLKEFLNLFNKLRYK